MKGLLASANTNEPSIKNRFYLLPVILFTLGRSCNAWITLHSTYSRVPVTLIYADKGKITSIPPETTDRRALLKQFRSGEVPLITVNDFVSPSMVQRLLFDAQDLERFNFGSIAGVGQKSQLAAIFDGKKSDQTIRKNVRQIWLRSNDGEEPNLFTTVYRVLANRWANTPLVGDLKARNELIALVEQLRYDLAVGMDMGEMPQDTIDGIRNLHPRMIELSYLSYYPGSFYRRHIDTFTSNNPSKRVVSFILYLGGDNTGTLVGDSSQKPWCLETDGGALRIYGEEYAKYTNQPLISCSIDNSKDGLQHEIVDEDLSPEDKVYADIPPEPGEKTNMRDDVSNLILATYYVVDQHSRHSPPPSLLIDSDTIMLQVQWLYLIHRKFRMPLWRLHEVDDASLDGSIHL